jgi:simple sugar transport system ATP-binding protein
MEGISKTFGSLRAVDNVSLRVRAGEVHALLGENGAGKSTLMNCLFGLCRPDSGKIKIAGREVAVGGPKAAIAHGVGMVHQHFKLIGSLTVADNVFMGRERTAGGVLTRRGAQRREVRALAERHGMEADPEALVSSLSIGARQRVEILRALSQEVKILVLDEPTAVLAPQEVEALFLTLRRFVAAGLGIVLISHHLSEVLAVADRVSVLRGGRLVAEKPVSAVDEHELAELIVGKTLPRERPPSARGKPGAAVLSVEELRVTDSRGKRMVDGVGFEVRAGEIVGVAGIAGNGQSELAEAISGIRQPDRGRVMVGGQDVAGRPPAFGRRCGVAHIPEDRNGRGLGMSLPVAENLALARLGGRKLGWPFLRRAAVAANARELIDEFGIKVASLDMLAQRLSGGNAQKVVLARELSASPAVIIACEPVRGLDVAATEFVNAQMIRHRDRGAGVLLICSELPEVLGLADRVLVMFQGRIVGEFADRRPTELEVGKLMLGLGT